MSVQKGGREGHVCSSQDTPHPAPVCSLPQHKSTKVCVGEVGADRERANTSGDLLLGGAPPGTLQAGHWGCSLPAHRTSHLMGPVASRVLEQPGVPAFDPRRNGGLYGRAWAQGTQPRAL